MSKKKRNLVLEKYRCTDPRFVKPLKFITDFKGSGLNQKNPIHILMPYLFKIRPSTFTYLSLLSSHLQIKMLNATPLSSACYTRLFFHPK